MSLVTASSLYFTSIPSNMAPTFSSFKTNRSYPLKIKCARTQTHSLSCGLSGILLVVFRSSYNLLRVATLAHQHRLDHIVIFVLLCQAPLVYLLLCTLLINVDFPSEESMISSLRSSSRKSIWNREPGLSLLRSKTTVPGQSAIETEWPKSHRGIRRWRETKKQGYKQIRAFWKHLLS